MDEIRWNRIKTVFDAALGREPDERAALLDRECEGDPDLRAEVESLLASFAESDSFLERPAVEHAARRLARDRASVVGRTLGRYEVLAVLGSGGMGDVYLARDERLGRRVALKLLPARFAADAERLRRFELEVRAVSALNHPNIVTLYDVDEVEGTPCMATELVEGETLRQRLGRGRLEVSEAVRIAEQIASALAAAHAAGIVHRDVKPENVMLRPDGFVKVLDFGIAKLLELDPRAETVGGIAREITNTTIGALGTVAYMSPEQAAGERVDARTDVWSLGVVLYEMVAGRPPFAGATETELLEAIFACNPEPLARAAPGIPATLERVAAKALARSADDRYATVDEMAAELRSVAGRAGEPDRSAERRWAAGAALATALALAVGGIALALRARGGGTANGSSEPPSIRRLVTSGNAYAAAVSRDGSKIAYVLDKDGRRSVRVRDASGSTDVEVVPPSEQFSYTALVFTPDASTLYFIETMAVAKGEYAGDPAYIGGLARVGLAGGEPEMIDFGDGRFDARSTVTFSPDGRRLAVIRYKQDHIALVEANFDGGDEREITRFEYDDFPRPFQIAAWSPDGDVIVCATGDATNVVWARNKLMALVGVRVSTGERFPITTDREFMFIGDVAWLPDGDGLLLDAATAAGDSIGRRQIWRMDYPSGRTRRISSDWAEYRSMSVTADGRSIVALQDIRTAHIWVAPDGDVSRATQVTSGVSTEDGLSGLAWTPDGQRIVYATRPNGNNDLWIVGADGSDPRQLTNAEGDEVEPVVSPDGRYVFYTVSAGASAHVWRLGLGGSGTVQLTSGQGEFSPACSPDGRWIVYCTPEDGEEQPATFRVPVEGGEPVRLTGPSIWRQPPMFTPDRQWLVTAEVRKVTGRVRREFVIRPAAGGDPTRRISLQPEDSTPMCVSSRDGGTLTYVGREHGASSIWLQPLTGATPKRLASFAPDDVFCAAWSPDGTRLAYSRGALTHDVVELTNVR